MDSQDNVNNVNISFAGAKEPANYVMPPHNLNQFSPLNIPMQPIYHFDPSNGSYAVHMDQNNMPRFSFQNMMNAPLSTRNGESSNAAKKRAKGIQDTEASQLAILKQDWTTEEEVALTEAWLYISTDADVGTNQRSTAMWNRILDVWKEKMGPGHSKKRNNNALQCHWHQIRGAVSKFVAKYEQLERHPKSGSNSEDLLRKALELYKDFYGTHFKFLHCWTLLAKNSKWCSENLTKTGAQSKGKSDKTKAPLVDDSSTPIGEDQPPPDAINSESVVRPQGRKACKEKKRKLATSSMH
ncbi:unnamed protein product [Cuscuta epithymum]|uniref:No apical meristem-associated C-terminal domain-containing protein n=1 Tax=Cuscuta epithymum TaxID=186058 RepID=A0AAV0FDI2_9ASTE|nr:unnamed protein product [Cuscuta epithymum]